MAFITQSALPFLTLDYLYPFARMPTHLPPQLVCFSKIMTISAGLFFPVIHFPREIIRCAKNENTENINYEMLKAQEKK